MGPQVGGNPDLFAVHNGRIYIFGSGQCQQLFEAAPEKYLEPSAIETPALPEALKRGQALIDRATGAFGGEAKIDGLTSYQETGLGVVVTSQGETQFKIQTIKLFPDHLRREQVRQFGTTIEVLTPKVSFSLFRNQTQNAVRDLPAGYRLDLEKQLRRNVLEVIRARKQPDFRAAAIGTDKLGEAIIEQVRISLSGVQMILGIEASTGRVLRLSYIGRLSSSGEIGEVVQTFSDFRTVDGLTLPFKRTGAFKGVVDPQLSFSVESVVVNARIDPTLFERPAK